VRNGLENGNLGRDSDGMQGEGGFPWKVVPRRDGLRLTLARGVRDTGIFVPDGFYTRVVKEIFIEFATARLV
jgi:hypothetical protein